MYLECHVHVSLHIPLVLQDVLEAGRHVRHDLRQVLQTQALGHPDILRLLEKIYNFERYNRGTLYFQPPFFLISISHC